MTPVARWTAAGMLVAATCLLAANGGPGAASVGPPVAVAESPAPAGDSPVAGDADEATLGDVERVREYLKRLEAFGLAGGFLLARDGRVLVARGYGLADRGDRSAMEGSAPDARSSAPSPSPWTASTVSSVGSITKQFTAAAIMKLVDRGRIAVTDSLHEFFEGVPEEKRGITLHHLLTHTAGWGEVGAGDFDFLSREEIVRRALESDLLWEPGTRYRYSNLGYSLLGAVVEVVTGEGYEPWLRRELFAPAGMYETGYLLPGYEPERVATGYRSGERWGTLIERLDPATGPSWVLRANGGIHTTLFDMLRWVRALGVMEWDDAAGTSAILSEASRERMFTPHADEGGGTWYGYGWVVDDDFLGRSAIVHNGGNGILHADLHLFPDDGVLTFMMTSDSDMRATRLLTEVDRVFFGEDVEMPPAVEAAEIRPAAVRRWVGSYALDGGGRLVVRESGRALVLEAEGQAAVNRLWRGEPAGTVSYDVLNDRAGTFARAFGEGDYATMRELMGPDAPQEPYRRFRERMLGMMGPLDGVEVLGTVPAWFHDGSSEATWLRLRFGDRTTIRRIHWSADGRVAGVGGQVYAAPLVLRCAMTGPAACMAWHEGLELAAPEVDFVGERGDGIPRVIIRGDGVEIRGRRTG